MEAAITCQIYMYNTEHLLGLKTHTITVYGTVQLTLNSQLPHLLPLNTDGDTYLEDGVHVGGNEVLAQLARELASKLRQARVVEQKYLAHMDSSNHLLWEIEMQIPAQTTF